LSVAFEHPKSSLPPAQAAPLSAGNMIAAASISFQNLLFIFALRSFDPAGAAERPSNSVQRKRAMSPV
jgi:hypothetical protein